MAKITRALVSVSDKAGLVDFVKGLRAFGVEILSTGGTAKLLADAGVPVVAVSDHTGSPEILDGRVKTLHPKIHGGILGRRDDAHHQRADGARIGIAPIDMVVVNLYPFERRWRARTAASRTPSRTSTSAGRRWCARRRRTTHDVTVLVDPADYAAVLDEMRRSAARSRSRPTRRLARKGLRARRRTTTAPSPTISAAVGDDGREPFGDDDAHRAAQGAGSALRREPAPAGRALRRLLPSAVEQLHGKELSYNNIVDINAALELMLEFVDDADAAVAISSTTRRAACGDARRASSKPIAGRFSTDPDSPFGGIVVSNQTWTLETGARGRRDLHRGADRAGVRAGRARVPAQEEEPALDALAPRGDRVRRWPRAARGVRRCCWCRTPTARWRIRDVAEVRDQAAARDAPQRGRLAALVSASRW